MAAALGLTLTVAALSSLYRDILRLLRSGMVRTFLSEGGCRDVAGGVSPDSRTGVLVSAEKGREVLGRLVGWGGGIAKKERRQLRWGGSLLPATGAPRPAAWYYWNEQDNATDTQAAV